MIKTSAGKEIPEELISDYFKILVNRFFKILPIRESGEKSLPIYLRSLQIELAGCKEFIGELNNDSRILTLLSILQYFIDNPSCPIDVVKREVFKAISICNKLESTYTKAV